MAENIIINTAVPVLFAYGSFNKEDAIKDKALQWLSELSPEKNTITTKWTSNRVINKNALESQGLLELKNNYCNLRRCIECSVGNAILKSR
jgi:transposase